MTNGYPLLFDPASTWTVIGSMLTAAAVGAFHVVRTLWKNANVRRGLGLSLGLEEDAKKSPVDLTEALIQFVRNQEARSMAEKSDGDRRWEHIEKMYDSINELTSEIKQIASSMQANANNQNAALIRIENSQVGLATWVYQNFGRVQNVKQGGS